jgi:iron complex outermembrane receptor protein
MNIQVTSVSKTQQALSQAASAIFVITPEDILRSGAANIPDLLRMVPGIDVAQINANTWAVTSRGFNGRFSNALLVLVDGRTVYSPTFGGVFWDALDLPLEDIARVEVIRGPGGSVWGSNAVNGVINIITKKSSDTPGALVVAGGGNTQQGFGTLQYGGRAGKGTDYSVFAKYLNEDHQPDAAGQEGGDGWHMLRGGFRVDTVATSRDTFMIKGDLYTAREGTPTTTILSVTSPAQQPIELLVNLSGGYLQGVWNHVFSPQSDTSLQISYDRYTRNDLLREDRGTLAVDFQHHMSRWNRQNIVWGFTYRDSNSTTMGNFRISLNPPDVNTQLFSGFFQDEIALLPNRVFLTVGTKVEHNYYSGVALMPSLRLAWTPRPSQTVWMALSKVDRTPSALDASIRSDVSGFPGPGGVPALVALIGNPDVGDESLIAYELGYRSVPIKQLSIDFTTYYNDYNHQDTVEPGAPFFENTPSPPHLVIPLTYQNLMHGESHGAEVALNWQATDRWSLSPGYAFEQIHMHLDPTSQDTTSVMGKQGSSPVNSAQLRSHILLGHGLTSDTSVYFVDRLSDPREPSYTRLDTQITWQIRESLSIGFVGQNLVKDHHEEFVDSTASASTTMIKRSAYAKLVWRF